MAWETKIPARFIDFASKVLSPESTSFGMKLLASGGGSGTWAYIDEQENVVDLPDNFFNVHPVYSNISSVTSDGQQFVKIPKFYVRYGTDGNTFWISSEKKEGYRIHPAFDTGKRGTNVKEEYDYILIGAYTMRKDDNNRALSTGGNTLVETSFESFKKYADNRNAFVGVSGYHMWNIYELSAIIMLAMLEAKSTDFQSKYGRGNSSSSGLRPNNDFSENGSATAAYRGIYALWGNAWQFVDGIKVTDKKINVWANNGTQEYLTTDVEMNTRSANNVMWTDGYTKGYYSKRSTDVGKQYDMSEVFVPDFNYLTGDIKLSNFSDCAYTSTGNGEKVCCVGGDYNSGEEAGLFAMNFDVLSSDATLTNVTSRLAKY